MSASNVIQRGDDTSRLQNEGTKERALAAKAKHQQQQQADSSATDRNRSEATDFGGTVLGQAIRPVLGADSTTQHIDYITPYKGELVVRWQGDALTQET